MSRTNKMWILKQKQQVAKQKKIIGEWGSTNDEVDIKRDFENPKWNSYTFFKRSGKWICDTTNCREDADGYRLVGRPNSGDVDFEYKWANSRGFRRYSRTSMKIKIVKNK
jgi:hypothetical protein